jgi:dolichyl-phosphooligosaccharide-protein glycotransferase
MKRRVHTEETVHTAHEPFYQTRHFWSIVATVLLLIAAVGLAFSIRLSTVELHVTENWAESSLRQQGINQIAQNIRQQYPSLPEQSVQTEAAKQWEQYREQNKALVDEQQKVIAQQFRDFFQYEAGTDTPYPQTYVLEMDPYHFWHKAENYADHGTVCDVGSQVYDDGSCHDAKRVAPVGTIEFNNLHIVLEAFAIKIGKALNKNLDSLSIVFFVPAILAALAVIPAFFIGRKLAGNMGGFAAAVIIAVHPLLINRTIAGFADTDAYNFLFPLLIVWFLLEALDARQWWSRITFSALAGLSAALFAFAWGGWWFMFFIVIVALLAYMLYRIALIVKRHATKNLSAYKVLREPLAVIVVFYLTAALVATLLLSFSAFNSWITSPFSFNAHLQAATVRGDLTAWPNILTTVAELNIPSLGSLIGGLGGAFVVTIAAIGLFLTLIDPRNLKGKHITAVLIVVVYYAVLIMKGTGLQPMLFVALFALPLVCAMLYVFFFEEEVHIHAPLILMAWLMASLLAATKGIRFLMLGVPPFAIGFGVAIGWLFIATTHALIGERKDLLRYIGTHVAVGLILALIIFNPAAAYSPLKQGKNAAAQQIPGMNDAWWSAMEAIREQTPPDTIITSWWDFGHWFRNIAQRGVTFDGGSQNPEPGHWVGKILLTSNETEALGILRMLDCNQSTAYRVAHQHLDILPSKMLIDEIILLNRAQAQKRLAATTIPQADQEKILEATHCTPPNAVFITSGDMIGKAGVWGHFGSWDFKRAVAYEYASALPQQEAITKIQSLGYTPEQATEMYFTIKAFNSDSEANGWIAGWPGYITQDWRSCNVQNNTVSCPLYIGISQTAQGTVAIESVDFNKSAIKQATVTYGLYSNTRLGGSTTKPAKLVIADDNATTLQTYNYETKELNLGVVIHKNGDAYAVLITDPRQADSLFTQLYFLDGRYTPHFTKFTEQVEFGGSKIIVWNVTWPEQ